MLSAGPITQPVADSHRGSSSSDPWTTGTEPGCSPRFGELFIHTQQQTAIQTCGLPSPAPTAPAASPSDWPKHDASCVTSAWPASPISPTAGEGVAVGFNNHLLYPPHTTQPLFDVGFQNWIGTDANFNLNFNHGYSGAPPVTSLTNAVSPDLACPWPNHNPTTTVNDEKGFLETPFGHNISSDSNTNLSSTSTEPCTFPQNPSMYLPRKRPLSLSQQGRRSLEQTELAVSTHQLPVPPPPPPPAAQASEMTTPATSNTASTTPEPTNIRTEERVNQSKPSTSSTTASVRARAGACGLTLRTAARRAKRPAPRPRPGESAAHQRARANHNLVEQKYRHRLHARFEALLDALPEGILSEDSIDQARDNGGAGWDDGSGTSGGRGVKGKNNRRMSKVDVLSKAERVIRFLEGDIERIKGEMEELRRQREAVYRTGARTQTSECGHCDWLVEGESRYSSG